VEYRRRSSRQHVSDSTVDERSSSGVVSGRGPGGELRRQESESYTDRGRERNTLVAGRHSRSIWQSIGREQPADVYSSASNDPESSGILKALEPGTSLSLAPDSIVENLATGLVVINRDNAVEFLNSSAEALLGIGARQAKNEDIKRLRPGLNELLDLIERSRSNESGYSREIKLWSPERESQAISVHVTPMTEPEGGLLLELSDATQRQQIDRETNLINQHGVSRQIIRQLAHEIRNPLGGLRGAAQLLERELPTPELKEFTRIIIGEADRLAGLMNNLLGPTKPPKKDPVNVHEVLEHVASLIENEAHDHDLKLTRDYDPSLPPLMLDRDQMVQAVLNIARNAMQSLDRGGELIIRTRALTNVMLGKQPKKLVASIEIEDNGPGVPEDIRDSLFFPLVSGRSGGSGLGLPLAQDLVSRHKGLIEFTSEPGRTVFMLRLPLEDV